MQYLSSTANRIIKNTGWLYAKMGITMFISLYTTRLILGGLGANDFGIYNIVGGAIAMLGFLNAAMASATQRFINFIEGTGEIEKKITIFNTSYLLHLGLSLFIVIVLLIAGFFFFGGILNIQRDRLIAAYVVYGSLIVSTFFTVISVPYDAILNSHENMKFYALVGIFESVLKLCVAFICIYSTKDRLIIYGILMAFIPISTRLIMGLYCHRKYYECKININKYFDLSIMKRMLSFAGWNFLTIASSMLSQYGIGIVLNHFFGTILNAAQGIANQVSGVLQTLSMNAMKAMDPVLVKNEGAKDREKVHYIISVGSRMNYAIFGFFSLPLILLAPEVISIWLKEVPEWAIIFCQFQLIQQLFDKLSGNMHNAIYAQGNIKNYALLKSFLNILPLVTSIIAFIYGCPPYFIYILWILFFSVIGGCVIAYYCKKLVNFNLMLYFKQVLLPCLRITIISITIYFISLYLFDFHYDKFFAIIIFFIIYVVSFWNDILLDKERKQLSSFISNMLKKSKNISIS